MQNVFDALDAAQIEGLALDKQPTGWVASLSLPPGHGNWSPLEFATTPSDAISKALRLHGPVPLAPPPY
ncbi:hypothetical protein ACWX0K_15210 [Nitrobacteraceae bacterium UC4446_H13]